MSKTEEGKEATREREGAPGSSGHAKFLLSPFRSSSLGSLPDTEFEPAAGTSARYIVVWITRLAGESARITEVELPQP